MKEYDVTIVGGGVTGTALLFVLAKYTNVKSILILEKAQWVATVNSNPMNNAQTSHDGGTETNYSLSHALEVRQAAIMLRSYVDSKANPLLSEKRHRMVLGVGEKEVEGLKQRFEQFSAFYPDLSFASREDLQKIEPMVMQGRDPQEPVCALVSSEGYMVNYQLLSETFLSDAKRLRPDIEVHFNTGVKAVRREGDMFVLETAKGFFRSKTIEFASGSYSLFFAQALGYGLDYAILPVAGSFYSGGNLLKGKVYRVQIEGMPFAAIHGDPDILDMSDTRFGPTTKPLPLMERHKYGTFPDFMKIRLFSLRGFWSLFKILANKKMLSYVAKNFLYDLPLIGPWLFLREVRPIVPQIRYRDLKLRRGAGGIRPQIVDLKSGKLIMGDVTITGENCIFNTTPSPGASVCLANAKRDAERLVRFLGPNFSFDKKQFEADLES